MLVVLHVQAVVTACAFNQGSRVKYAKSSLAQGFRLPDHLAVIVGVQPVTTTIPRHDQDDVPNVGR